jgi:hypothetical protein
MISTFHIVLAMKPISGNFVQNALKHGVAGINVDGCRISGPKGEGVWGTSNKTINTDRKFNTSPDMGEYRSEAHSAGRWPPNVILGHLEGCKIIGTKKVKGDGHWTNKSEVGEQGIYGRFNAMDIDRGNILEGADGKETVEAWECQEGCPVRVMDEQSGNKCGACAPVKGTESSETGQNGIYGKYNRVASAFPNDGIGGASRFFKQVKEE